MRQQPIHMLSKHNSNYGQAADGNNICNQEMERDSLSKMACHVFEWEFITIHTDDGEKISIDLNDLSAKALEKGTLEALIRGVAAAYVMRGVALQGFEIEMQAKCMPGNGLTTYYGFALLIAGMINEMFCEGLFAPAEVAEIARHAETKYFGKPANQVDLKMSSVSGVAFIDTSMAGKEKDEFISFCFNDSGLNMHVVDRGEGGRYSTEDNNVSTEEVRETCAYFGKKNIAEIDEQDFFRELPKLRGHVSDQSIFSTIRAYQSKRIMQRRSEAIEERDFDSFVHLIAGDDKKAWIYLQ